jgi:hypothetical protein
MRHRRTLRVRYYYHMAALVRKPLEALPDLGEGSISLKWAIQQNEVVTH